MAGLALVVAVTTLGACERSPYKLTKCVNGQPVVERIHDVAPPNC
jgi:hypothetical protein